MRKTIAALVAATGAAVIFGSGVAHADCQTVCYDSGNNGEVCTQSCTDYGN